MEIILHDGQEFALGCMPRSAAVGSVRPCLAEAMTLIPKDKWEPCDFSDLVPPVPSQGSHGSCVGHQCTDAVQTARVIAGMPSVALSPWDLYSQICGGRDGGANIHDALSVLQGRGVSTLAACPDYTLHAKDAARDADAKKHQTTESFDCPDRPSIATAVQLRFPTPLGIQIYGNFTSLESIKGKPCVPKPAGRLRGGHCVLGCGLDYIAGVWMVKIATKSWGLDFGDQGCVWYQIDWIDNSYADGWCVRAVTISDE
jgi:hypothetical protein